MLKAKLKNKILKNVEFLTKNAFFQNFISQLAARTITDKRHFNRRSNS